MPWGRVLYDRSLKIKKNQEGVTIESKNSISTTKRLKKISMITNVFSNYILTRLLKVLHITTSFTSLLPVITRVSSLLGFASFTTSPTTFIN